jgi:ornithine--oxo-acid transaminase
MLLSRETAIHWSYFIYSIRFAPPLVISEEDLDKAIKIIGECLNDLDVLDEIPGEEGSENGHVDTLTL